MGTPKRSGSPKAPVSLQCAQQQALAPPWQTAVLQLMILVLQVRYTDTTMYQILIITLPKFYSNSVLLCFNLRAALATSRLGGDASSSEGEGNGCGCGCTGTSHDCLRIRCNCSCSHGHRRSDSSTSNGEKGKTCSRPHCLTLSATTQAQHKDSGYCGSTSGHSRWAISPTFDRQLRPTTLDAPLLEHTPSTLAMHPPACGGTLTDKYACFSVASNYKCSTQALPPTLTAPPLPSLPLLPRQPSGPGSSVPSSYNSRKSLLHQQRQWRCHPQGSSYTSSEHEHEHLATDLETASSAT